MTTPSVLQAATDACANCGEVVQWVEAPVWYHQTGYFGYWYHPTLNHVFCQPDTEGSPRAEPTDAA